MDIVEPHPSRVISLFRALHTFHAELSPGMYHCDGTDADYQTILENICAGGGRIFAHDDGWGLVSYVLARPDVLPRTAMRCERRLLVIEHFYVAPVVRGMGLGRQLIARVEDWVRDLGLDGWHLTHHASNSDAERFYRSVGAEPKISVSVKSVV
ncbi:GNAT family N-acetyltransferase [uncultured Marivita sp.]|uniref:GNAT family N-acetyltransferase n=1 Tax=uncultured Marivita sp. TaxID=888080 RepID=UPI00263168ED|nr:GNAT family N-acetyltransferase [uncultured Marivita sp.]